MANHLTAAASAAPAFHISTIQGQLGGVPQTLALARTLHGSLGVGRDFSNWIKDRVEQLGLVEAEDYLLAKIGEQLPSGTKSEQ